MLHDAMFYEKHNNGKVKCYLCPHNCLIADGSFGLCSVRTNKEGELKTINYGEITSIAEDPIEKKPLYHFKPGKKILSAGSFGCNFTCDFCQNYSIAQFKPESKYLSPDKLIDIMLSIEDNVGIAFTYNEPSIWYEYIFDTAKRLKEKKPDLNVVLVTNGYIESEPLAKLLPYVDAMNIDLKSFQEQYYKKVAGGELKSVLRTIESSYDKTHIEITTLMVNGLNDSKEEIKEIASFLGSLDRNIPLHLTRYFPTYKMKNPSTELTKMTAGKEVAEKYLNYVYLGNVAYEASTHCPRCNKLLVERNGYSAKVFLKENKCPECGFDIKLIL